VTAQILPWNGMTTSGFRPLNIAMDTDTKTAQHVMAFGDGHEGRSVAWIACARSTG
jgi:hypothetical protein